MLVAMILVTVGILLSSLWDRNETVKGINQGRLREGNFVVRLHGALNGKLKMAMTGVAMGLFWLSFFVESETRAVVYGSILMALFCAAALWARKAGR